MFENLEMNSAVAVAKDVLGGGGKQFTVESGVYEFNIDMAYIDVSSGGAMAVVVTFVDSESMITHKFWVASGNAKGNKNYSERDGIVTYLPDFVTMNDMCRMLGFSSLKEVMEKSEEKVIALWDFTEGKKLPVSKRVLTSILDKTIIAGVIKRTVDKEAKTGQQDASGKDVYAATGETRDTNIIDKVFAHPSRLTVVEATAGLTAGEFIDVWSNEYTGKTQNRSKGVNPNATAPAQTSTVATAKPATSLFPTE